jgi:hypothetical protein
VVPTGLWVVVGIDQHDRRLYVEDVEHRLLRQSGDWGKTFSGNKSIPPNVISIGKIIRFKSHLLAVGRDARTQQPGVYRAVPTNGNTPLRWQGPSLTISQSAGVLPSDFNSDSRFVYLGEYGDPKPGPRLYRSADGVNWETVFGPAIGIRHVHGVAGDPYRPGDVWMTLGDGVPAVWRSATYGARGSWRTVVRPSSFQSAQISFDRSRIYLAADTSTQTFFVIDRKTLRPRLGTPQYYQRIHPPGSPRGTLYLWSAFFGAVDPKTGIYYCVANDDSGRARGRGGSWQGFFAVRRVGDRVTVLDPGGQAISMNGEIYFGGGRVWSGQWSLPLLR